MSDSTNNQCDEISQSQDMLFENALNQLRCAHNEKLNDLKKQTEYVKQQSQTLCRDYESKKEKLLQRKQHLYKEKSLLKQEFHRLKAEAVIYHKNCENLINKSQKKVLDNFDSAAQHLTGRVKSNNKDHQPHDQHIAKTNSIMDYSSLKSQSPPPSTHMSKQSIEKPSRSKTNIGTQMVSDKSKTEKENIKDAFFMSPDLLRYQQSHKTSTINQSQDKQNQSSSQKVNHSTKRRLSFDGTTGKQGNNETKRKLPKISSHKIGDHEQKSKGGKLSPEEVKIDKSNELLNTERDQKKNVPVQTEVITSTPLSTTSDEYVSDDWSENLISSCKSSHQVQRAKLYVANTQEDEIPEPTSNKKDQSEHYQSEHYQSEHYQSDESEDFSQSQQSIESTSKSQHPKSQHTQIKSSCSTDFNKSVQTEYSTDFAHITASNNSTRKSSKATTPM